jgi:hypothetical protein
VAHHHDLGWNWFDPSLIGAGAVMLAAAALIATAAPRLSPTLIIMEAEVSVTGTAPPQSAPALQPTESEKIFLDHLMMAESGGREDARNPRSSALGPYQFLGSTFLDVMGRYFPTLTSGKSDEQVLQLRTDHAVARDAALVYTRENAAFLLDRGLEANAAHLRLAFLVGATGAQRVIAAHAETPVAQLLSTAALEANPFLRGMTAAELIQRAAAEASGVHIVSIPENVRRPKFAGIRVRCSLGRPSCRKWVALAMKRKGRNAAAQATAPETKPGAAGGKNE